MGINNNHCQWKKKNELLNCVNFCILSQEIFIILLANYVMIIKSDEIFLIEKYVWKQDIFRNIIYCSNVTNVCIFFSLDFFS